MLNQGMREQTHRQKAGWAQEWCGFGWIGLRRGVLQGDAGRGWECRRPISRVKSKSKDSTLVFVAFPVSKDRS